MFENYSIATSNSGQAGAPAQYISPSFNEAVNASRFVKGFGITALIYSLVGVVGVTLLGGGIGLGVSLFIMRYDQAKYYRILGIVVMVFAIVGAFIPFLGSIVLSGAILGKGIQVLSILGEEGRNDEEWTPSRRRAIIGTIASGIGLLISIALMFLVTLRLAAMLLR